MVIKEGGLKLIQIQDNGTGIRVSKTSEEQDVCALHVIPLQDAAKPFPVLEILGFCGWDCLTKKFNTCNKYLLSTSSKLGTVQGKRRLRSES